MPAVPGKKKRPAGRVSVTVHLPLETYQAIQTALGATQETQSTFIALAAHKRAMLVNAKTERAAA